MKRQIVVFAAIGSGLMAYGGASIGTQLSANPVRTVPVALFAIGILLISYTYSLRVETRVAALEAELRALRSAP